MDAVTPAKERRERADSEHLGGSAEFTGPEDLLPFGGKFPTVGRGRPSNLPPHLNALAKSFSWAGWKTTTRRDGYIKTADKIADTHAKRQNAIFEALPPFADVIAKHSANRAAEIIKRQDKTGAFRDVSVRTLRRYVTTFKEAGQIA